MTKTNMKDQQKPHEYHKILEAVCEVAIVAYTDKFGNITYANEKFCHISGYSMQELFQKNHRILNSSHHPREFFNEMYRTLMSGKIWRGDIRNKKKDGGFYWVDTQIIPIQNGNGEIESFASIRFDITERKNMEMVLMEIEKLASVCEMAKSIAHEINNPLTIIELCCAGLNRELNNTKPNLATRKKIFKIIQQSKRISLIVKELKTYSRKESPQFKKAS